MYITLDTTNVISTAVYLQKLQDLAMRAIDHVHPPHISQILRTEFNFTLAKGQ